MNAQLDKYIAPVRELNELAIDNFEKVVALQIKRLEENTRIGVEQLKGATAVKDAEGFKEYLGGCAELARALTEKAVEDARTAFEWGNSYQTEAQRIFKSVLKVN